MEWKIIFWYNWYLAEQGAVYYAINSILYQYIKGNIH